MCAHGCLECAAARAPVRACCLCVRWWEGARQKRCALGGGRLPDPHPEPGGSGGGARTEPPPEQQRPRPFLGPRPRVGASAAGPLEEGVSGLRPEEERWGLYPRLPG